MLWSPDHLAPLLDALSHATTIRVAVGNTSGGPVLELLASRSAESIPVLVVTGCGGGTTRREAIERLRASGADVRVVDDRSGGLFHAKIFGVRFPNGEVQAFVGSANLSSAAFGENCEVLCPISLDNHQWESLGRRLDEAGPMLADLDDLPGPPPPPPGRRPSGGRIALSDVLQMTWPEYVQALKFMDTWWLSRGWRVFGEGPGWTHTVARLRSFTRGPLVSLRELERKILVGKVPGDNVAFFGDFNATPSRDAVLKAHLPQWVATAQAIDTARATIGRVGDPLSIGQAEAAMNDLLDNSGIWLGIASRLLLSIRPDVFISVNNGSRELLQGGTRLRFPRQAPRSRRCPAYRSLLESVQDAPWYNVPRPSDALGRTVWDARAALLDVFVYEP